MADIIQILNIGAGTSSFDFGSEAGIRWTPPADRLIDPGFVEDGATAYLRSFSIEYRTGVGVNGFSRVKFQTNGTDDTTGSLSGPNMIAEWLSHDNPLAIEIGGVVYELSIRSDATEPYSWNATNNDAYEALIDAYRAADAAIQAQTKLILRRPPGRISQTFDLGTPHTNTAQANGTGTISWSPPPAPREIDSRFAENGSTYYLRTFELVTWWIRIYTSETDSTTGEGSTGQNFRPAWEEYEAAVKLELAGTTYEFNGPRHSNTLVHNDDDEPYRWIPRVAGAVVVDDFFADFVAASESEQNSIRLTLEMPEPVDTPTTHDLGLSFSATATGSWSLGFEHIAEQWFTIGATNSVINLSFLRICAWTVSGALVDSGFVENGGDAYLRVVTIQNYRTGTVVDYIRLAFHATDESGGDDPGPELVEEWQDYADAIALEIDGVVYEIPLDSHFGPNSGSPDDEPYRWNFSTNTLADVAAAYYAADATAQAATRIRLRRLVVPRVVIDDAIGIADNLDTLTDGEVISDTVGVADSVATSAVLETTVNDAIGVADSVSTSAELAVVVNDEIGVADSFTQQFVEGRITVTLLLGSASYTSDSSGSFLRWNPPTEREIPAVFMANGMIAYLRWVLIGRTSNTSPVTVEMYLSTSDFGDGRNSEHIGEDLVTAWEEYDEALTFEIAGTEYVVGGPNAMGSVNPDPYEPYSWDVPASGDPLALWTAIEAATNIQRAQMRLTLALPGSFTPVGIGLAFDATATGAWSLSIERDINIVINDGVGFGDIGATEESYEETFDDEIGVAESVTDDLQVAPPPTSGGATDALVIGAGSYTPFTGGGHYLVWNPPADTALDGQFFPNGNVHYIRYFELLVFGSTADVYLTAAVSNTGSGTGSGQDLVEEWEANADGLAVEIAGTVYEIGGPNSSLATSRDVNESYDWEVEPSAITAIGDAYAAASAAQRAQTKLVFRLPGAATTTHDVGLTFGATATGALSVAVELVTASAVTHNVGLTFGATATGGWSLGFEVSTAASEIISDVVGIADSVIASDNRETVADAIGIADSVSVDGDTAVVINDGIGIADRVEFEADDQVTISDGIEIADTVSVQMDVQQTVNDAIGIEDTVEAETGVGITVNDAIGIADAASVLGESGVVVSDVIGVADRIDVSTDDHITVSDGIGVSDRVDVEGSQDVTINDAIGIREGVLAGDDVDQPAAPADRWKAAERSLGGQLGLYAMEIMHPDLPEPVRLVADTVDHVIEGHSFQRANFRPTPPQFATGEIPKAKIELGNVGKPLMALFEVTRGGHGATIRLMLVLPRDPADTESHIVWEIPALAVASASVTNQRVDITLAGRHGRRRPGVKMRHDTRNSPGVF